jgi:LacI family transcriptional regulator
MMLYTTHRHVGKETQYVNTIVSSMTDGLLLIVPIATDAYLQALRERHFPYVLVDQHDEQGNSSEVLSTNYDGAYVATNYLIELGHQRIAFITGMRELHSSRERLAGYKAALKDRSVPFRPQYVVVGDFWKREAYHATENLLSLPNRPTAIFAANDLTAIGAMNALHDHGLSVPQDMSVVGFDDIWQAGYMNPRLTTVRQSLEQMGRTGVQLLLEQIQNPDRPSRRVTLPTELIIRESCQPPST